MPDSASFVDGKAMVDVGTLRPWMTGMRDDRHDS
jgi:hypothetical protein